MMLTWSRASSITLTAALVALSACSHVEATLQAADDKIQQLAGSAAEQNASVPAAATGAADAADADVRQAVRLIEGDGVERDPAGAVDLIRPHAEAGHAEAQFLLGLAYGTGQGVAQDRATAAAWYRRAAAQEQAHAQFLLGLALLRGDGTAKDIAAATEWFARSARNGNAGAQFRLAIAYASGDGVDQDIAASTRWFERAADQGHAEAQYMAGEAYQVGRGVDKNRAWATRWFARAAAQGIADGQYMTGLAYAAGTGVAQDFATAYQWLWLAADRGADKAAPYRDRIGEQLTERQRAAARAAASGWQPAGPAATTGVGDAASIAFAQHTLAELGYDPGGVDGRFGPRTSGAIKAYQKARALPRTGTITKMLLLKLRNDPVHAG